MAMLVLYKKCIENPSVVREAAMYLMSDSTIEVGAEQRVWTAVIARTVEEWISGSLGSQREAESYLFNDETDFPDVCRSAGLDPQTLRRKLTKLKNSGAGPAPIRGMAGLIPA
jgi:hypothetical protein